MKQVIALGLALSLGGCAELDKASAWLASPTTTQAAQNVGSFVRAFACGLSTAAAAAQGVEATTYSGRALVDNRGQQITAVVYASSTAACKLLGGVVTSSTPVSVPAEIVVE